MQSLFQSKLLRWITTISLFSVFLRAMFLTGFKLYAVGRLEPIDWIAIPVAAGALYLSWWSFRRIDPPKESANRAQPSAPRPITQWLGAILSFAFFGWIAFALGSEIRAGHDLNGAHGILAFMGIVALYVSWMYFRRLFPAKPTNTQ